MSAPVPGWTASDLVFMLSFACQLTFWCGLPVLILAAITTTIDRQMPAIRAAIRAAREL